METVYIVEQHSNYGYNPYYYPVKRAFTSREDVIKTIKEETILTSEDWGYSMLETELCAYMKCSYGEYKYVTEEFSTTEWQ